MNSEEEDLVYTDRVLKEIETSFMYDRMKKEFTLQMNYLIAENICKVLSLLYVLEYRFSSEEKRAILACWITLFIFIMFVVVGRLFHLW